MLVFSAIVPHPPILIPNVGQENLDKLKKTIKGYAGRIIVETLDLISKLKMYLKYIKTKDNIIGIVNASLQGETQGVLVCLYHNGSRVFPQKCSSFYKCSCLK